MSQNENLYSEISLTKAQWQTLLAGYYKSGLRPTVVNLGSFSDGTRYVVTDQYRKTEFYLVSDLTAPIKQLKSFARLSSFTTGSTSFVSTGSGIGGAGVTFKSTANILAFFSGDGFTDTTGDGFGYGIYASLTGVPASGTAVGSDTNIMTTVIASLTANQTVPFARAGSKQLTKGTTYFPYMAFEALSGGNATLKQTGSGNPQVILLEV